jgi:hypothetical protein
MLISTTVMMLDAGWYEPWRDSHRTRIQPLT